MASKSDLILRNGRNPRLEGRTASIPLTDPQACRLTTAMVALTALTAIALTVWGALAPIHF
jgi:hypothetical protein